MNRQSYERWEVCISAKTNINNYVGYVKAQFLEDKRKYVVMKARGAAIENALKVMQLVKENLGGIHSQIKFSLQFERMDASVECGNREIRSFEAYVEAKLNNKIIPACEILMSTMGLNEGDPGYQKPHIKVEPIFYGAEKNMSAEKMKKLGRRRELDKEFMIYTKPPKPKNVLS